MPNKAGKAKETISVKVHRAVTSQKQKIKLKKKSQGGYFRIK